ncbi:MAG: hypothetical protein R2681_03255 [Pyrinomonadaceae bacterium]
MKKIILLSILIFLCSGIATAQNSTLKKIDDRQNGYSFTVPKNWTDQAAEGGYILLNTDKTASIVIKPHYYENFESFVAAEVNLQRDGLTQVGQVQDMGNGGRSFRAYKASGDKNLIIDTFFLRISAARGLFVVALSNDGDGNLAKTSFEAASEIIRSLKYSAPVQSQVDEQIRSVFSGKKLSFFYTGNGYSESKTIWLCSSGEYLSKNDSTSNSMLGSGATSAEDRGVWTIESNGANAFLVLTSKIGNGQRRFALSARQASNEVGLNGARYFVQTQSHCR